MDFGLSTEQHYCRGYLQHIGSSSPLVSKCRTDSHPSAQLPPPRCLGFNGSPPTHFAAKKASSSSFGKVFDQEVSGVMKME